MSDTQAVLSELTRVKALFQLRTIELVIRGEPGAVSSLRGAHPYPQHTPRHRADPHGSHGSGADVFSFDHGSASA